jgi:hypothetical protein
MLHRSWTYWTGRHIYPVRIVAGTPVARQVAGWLEVRSQVRQLGSWNSGRRSVGARLLRGAWKSKCKPR